VDIAIVTTRLVDKDAQGNFTAATASALKKKCGGRVSIYAFAYERPPIEGVDVHFMAGRNGHSLLSNAKVFLRTSALAKELSGYDALLLIGPDAGALPAAHRAKRYNPALKLLWVYHGLTPPEFLSSFKEKALTRIRRAAYLRSMRRSDLVQTFSRYIKNELAGEGIDPSKITVMPFGIDTAKFSSGDRDRVRARYGIGDGFLVMYVGRLASLKRVDELIRAMALIKEQDVRLMIVGGGPERESLETLSKKLGVDGRVIFAGRVDDKELPDYYAACDVWATASRHEGFCVPIVEAIAAGKPVIVPDLAAMPETAGDAGLIFPRGDAAKLAVKIDMVRLDRDLYAAFCAHARSRASSYDISRVMDSYVDMIMQFESKRGNK
jgi:glycosyltransferase involved in cell wall biosynthesis